MESLPAVLIVDDDRVVLHTLQEQLSRQNYRVAAISNVAEALQRLRVERFGIIMADQLMPETPGVEFLRMCREAQPLSARIIITGMAFAPDVEEAIARGDAFRILRKPWTRFDLTLALTQATDRYQLTLQLEAVTRETRRQRSDLAALGHQLESYRQKLLSMPAQPEVAGPPAVETEELFRLETRVRERTEELAWANLALETEISERRRAELQLREANQRLQKALAELHATQQQVIQQERLRALGKMAGGVAHDFNNALIPILGYAELLIERSELLDDRAMALKYLRLMRTAAKDATAVVGRLREFYRQRDETELFEAVDLLEALTEAISMTQPKWHDEALAQGLHITVEQKFQPVPTIACHSGEIREVVTNLLFNAVDALPQGGKIVVSAYSQDENAVFEVQDDGIGMTEEVRARCMEPFVTTKGERGTGLGLAMVYGIVQRHHGAIEVESKLGEGTLVRVRLPFYREAGAAERTDGPSMTRKLKILLVDDEQVVRDVIALFLRHEEHEVEITTSAIDALRLVREQKFDLVITDHAMPGMTGGNFVATLRSAGFDIPIVMLTGFGELMVTSGSVPAGVTKLVNKPVTMEDLRSAIAAVFHDSEVA
jgi:signal transduction histidine kinase